jgi:hypothetical protein
MIIKKQSTNPGLLAAIFESVQHSKPSEQEIHQKRISFIVGSMRPNSTVTREKIERVLAIQEGRAA